MESKILSYFSSKERESKKKELKELEEIRDNKPTWEDIGYVPQFMAYTSLPYKAPKELVFCRENGALRLEMTATKTFGLPFGVNARLVLIAIITAAKSAMSKKIWGTGKGEKKGTIILGDSLSDFVRRIGRYRTGGVNGDLHRVKEQLVRVANCDFCFIPITGNTLEMSKIPLASHLHLFNPDKARRKQNNDENTDEPDTREIVIVLSADLLKYLEEYRPIPIDLRIVGHLKNSAQAIDIYMWLCCRFFKQHDKPIAIPWDKLRKQFGSAAIRKIDFQRNFTMQLKKVLKWYPIVEFEEGDERLVFSPTQGIEDIIAILPENTAKNDKKVGF